MKCDVNSSLRNSLFFTFRKRKVESEKKKETKSVQSPGSNYIQQLQRREEEKKKTSIQIVHFAFQSVFKRVEVQKWSMYDVV